MASLLAAAPAQALSTAFLPKADSSLARKQSKSAAVAVAPTPRAAAAEPDVTPAPAAVSRRGFSLASVAAVAAAVAAPLPALADFEEKYQAETQTVIEKVRYTLNLPRDDPARPDAVNDLRELSNDWVAKYRREKTVAGRPSFSNMYSVLNAISGHYISFGPAYPIPKKRQDRIFEEVDIAERSLSRGR